MVRRRRVQLICTNNGLSATVLSQEFSWQIPHAVHLIRCFWGESESVIPAAVLAQSRLQAKIVMGSHAASVPLEPLSRLLAQRIEEIMDWIPVVFIAFKFLVLGTALFFSIKSHHDKQKEEQEEERERQNKINAS